MAKCVSCGREGCHWNGRRKVRAIKKWGYEGKELMKGRFACATSWSVRVFDNFQFIRNNIGEEGRKDGLESSTHFRSFSRSRGRERERETVEWKESKEGERERKRNKSISTSSTYFLYRWIIRAWPQVYTGKLLPRKSVQSLVVGKLIDQTIAHPFPLSFLPSIRPVSPFVRCFLLIYRPCTAA